MSDIVCIRTFSGRLEAEIARGVLEANDIRVALSADDMGGIRPELSFSLGVRLLVMEENAEEALSVLEMSAKE